MIDHRVCPRCLRSQILLTAKRSLVGQDLGPNRTETFWILRHAFFFVFTALKPFLYTTQHIVPVLCSPK